MNPSRFDSISRLFANRQTRRQVVAGSAAIAATVFTASHLSAQESTPFDLPAFDPADPHPSADDATHDPMFLFDQPFEAGTWAPKEGEEGTYVLALTGASANTVYFSDRPERIFGLAPTGPFLDSLGFTPSNPPNAALVAQREDGSDQEVLVIELLNPAYDGETLTYDARVLADYHEVGLAHAARQQNDYLLPETFARGSLFIDDCSSFDYECRSDLDGSTKGRLTGSTCWNDQLRTCVVCDDTRQVCMEQFPDGCKQTIINWQKQLQDIPVCTSFSVT